MTISDSRSVAVLTGDVVGSRKLGTDRLEDLFECLDSAAARLAKWPGNAGPDTINRSRGDSWQLALSSPRFALRACLFIRAAIKSADRQYDTRIGVGIGRTSRFDPGDVGASDGAAFQLSGAQLDDRSGHARFRIAIEGKLQSQDLFSAVFALCDRISKDWTAAQARVMYHLLAPENAGMTQQDIGHLLVPVVTQQQVGKAYLQAGGPALFEALAAFENWTWDQD